MPKPVMNNTSHCLSESVMRLRKFFTPIFFALALCSAALASAGETTTSTLSATSRATVSPLIELYTSEGCSSCPSADAWLRQLGASLGQDFHAVPLAFHVDYWNNLGWPDPYSKPAFTARQREVAANNRIRTIYTPQFTADGRDARGGANIIRVIREANARPAQATIALHIDRDTNGDTDNIVARIAVENHAHDHSAQAYFAIYESGITRQIGRGENRGKTLRHDFVVRHFSAPIAIHRGSNQADLTLELPADWQRANLGMAVLVLDRDSGQTVQSLNTSLSSLFAS